jgi:hypothetical protein
MTDTLHRTGYNYKPDHHTYGGEIELFDYEGHNTMCSIAEKIRKSESFDKKCKENIKNRNRVNNHRKVTRANNYGNEP